MAIPATHFRKYDQQSLYRSEIEQKLSPYIRKEFFQSDDIFKDIFAGKCSAELFLQDIHPLGLITFTAPKEGSKTFELKSLNVVDRHINDGKGFHRTLLDRVFHLAEKFFAERVVVKVTTNENNSIAKFFERSSFSPTILQDHILLSYQLPKKEEPQGQKRKREDATEAEGEKRPHVIQDLQPHKPQVTTHHSTLKEVYIRQIQAGQKTIEGRINLGMFRRFRAGDHVRFFAGPNEVYCRVVKVLPYKSFKDMLTQSDFKKCLPNSPNLQQAAQEYARIPGYSDKEKQFGVLAIHLEKIQKPAK